MEDMIALLRQSYIEKIEHHLGKNMIVILTGQRRVGKSCVLRLFKDKISENKENNIVYIDIIYLTSVVAEKSYIEAGTDNS